ncbi:MAG: exodeoxyribonuclease VII large subunit [Bacilli bacterium]
MDEKYLTVSAITRYLKAKFDLDENLKSVFLKGEISNFKAHTSGHLYFSVKDETSKINAIMFSRSAAKLDFKPVDGTKVLIAGRISIYEATGNYQIYVDQIIEDGVGNLYVAFEKLKKTLQAEGLFDKEHKKEIPKIPRRVGIVTASTGAAVRDIVTTIKRRFPICETILFPTFVQGDNAKDDIVRNIKRAEDYDIDVLIVGGGGSIEDLWPFNEEVVARAIYNSPIPIISAVGHEVDFTISDFVSELRAPTPTAAAELAMPKMGNLERNIEQLSIRLKEAVYRKLIIKNYI